MINLLNLSAGERVDLADFSFVAQDSVLGAARNGPEGLLTSPTKQTLWIVRGFTMSNPSGQILQVAKGSAILALRQGTRILQGVLTSDGADTVSVDLSSYSGATYNVYIRFLLSPGSFDTRTFFRASGGGAEYAQSVPTRLTGNWELQVASVSPGAEWLQIGTVTTPSMATVDMRPLYFEGRVDKATASGWGTAADRAPGGVTDLQTALAAVRQCLEDIKGPGIARWFTDHVAGQTIGYAGTAVASRTTWADDNFYAQGDADRPRLTFAADGAHIAYVRASGLMVATGPELGATQSSVTSSLSFRSGADNALVRGGFFRATAGQGSAGIDGSITRGPVGTATGGLGLYGASGLMGAAGVGLGYTLGSQAPALFVNANNLVGIGHASAATMVSTASYPLQLNVAASKDAYVAFHEAGVPKAWFGYANNVVVAAGDGAPAFTGAVISCNAARRLLFTQSGYASGMLVGGKWVFGSNVQSATASSIKGLFNINDTANPVSQTVNDPIFGTQTYYSAGTTLSLNNSGNGGGPYGYLSPYPSRIAFASGNADAFYVDGGSASFAISDVVNAVDVMRYSTTTKNATFANALKAPSYILSPALGITSTILGLHAIVNTGSAVQNSTVVGAAWRTVASASQSILVALPINASLGQTMQSVAVNFVCNATASVTATCYVERYDSSADAVSQLNQAQISVSANNSATQTVTVSINSETSTTYNSWYAVLSINSSASNFNATIKSAVVTMQTPQLSPQRQ